MTHRSYRTRLLARTSVAMAEANFGIGCGNAIRQCLPRLDRILDCSAGQLLFLLTSPAEFHNIWEFSARVLATFSTSV